MMMVVMLGGLMSLCMSCVGGIGGFYLMDPTLGGLLTPAASAPVPAPTGSDPPAPAPPGGGNEPSSGGNGIVVKKPYLLMYSTAKNWDGKARFLHVEKCGDNEKVKVNCYSPDKATKGEIFWIFEKGSKSNTYLIRGKSCAGKYLTFGDKFQTASYSGYDALLRPKLTGADRAKQEWYVKKTEDGITIANSYVNKTADSAFRFLGANLSGQSEEWGSWVGSSTSAAWRAAQKVSSIVKNNTICCDVNVTCPS